MLRPAAADFYDRVNLNDLFSVRAAFSGAKTIAFDVVEVFMRPAAA